MADQQPEAAPFDALYGTLSKDVFRTLADEAVAAGSDPDEQAQHYAELGKPDFALAYLLAGTLPEERKREVLARAYEQRAMYTEDRAREFDGKFHRPFPLLFSEAAKDRSMAKKIRAGKVVNPAAGRQLPRL